MRFWEGWCRARDSGAAIPPVVARIFSGDSTSPLTREARILCGARDYCPFAMGVRVTVFGATGGASKASDKCSFAKVVEMERVDATGGASKARMP